MRTSKDKLPLGQALKTYWPFLSGMLALQILIVFVPGFADHRPPVIVALVVAGAAASVPCLAGRAPYSFWIAACAFWMIGFLLMALLKAGALTLLAH